MRRLGLLVVLTAIMVIVGLAFGTGPVAAEEIPPHPHILLQRPEFGMLDGVPALLGVRKCIDLANNQALPLHSHHDHIHFGSAGVSFGGPAGHAVTAGAPFAPWADCADFATYLPLPLP